MVFLCFLAIIATVLDYTSSVLAAVLYIITALYDNAVLSYERVLSHFQAYFVYVQAPIDET